jgi:hypothetical protein
VKIHFACPSCDYPGRAETPSSSPWRCPQCDHLLSLAGTKDESVPSTCRVCGNGELYKKKDFPHTLGLAILTLACVASTITYSLYDKWLTWAILIGSAALDGLLYLWVKDVVVCYRCQAHHRGIATGSPVPPFDLAIGERYRQEQIRRDQLAAERSTVSRSS